MVSWEHTVTIDGGGVQSWIVGRFPDGTGYFNHANRVLIDAHQFPDITHGGSGPLLECSNPSCRMERNRLYSYVVTITNRGPLPIVYHLRIWVPTSL